jgi:hypothetical protein
MLEVSQGKKSLREKKGPANSNRIDILVITAAVKISHGKKEVGRNWKFPGSFSRTLPTRPPGVIGKGIILQGLAPVHSPHSGVAARQCFLFSVILRCWPRAFISGTGIAGPGAKAPALSPRAFPIPRKKKNEYRQGAWSDGAFQSFWAPNPGAFF